MNFADMIRKAFQEGTIAARVEEAKWGDNWGACGFATVRIDAYDGKKIRANSIVGKALAAEIGEKGYDGRFYVHQCCDYNGQNIDVKEAGAHAFQKVLAENGFDCFVDTRLD